MHAMAIMAILGKWRCCQTMAEMAKNRQRAGEIRNVANIQIECQKWPLGEWQFWENWRNWQRFSQRYSETCD